jgi:hypothetical protein
MAINIPDFVLSTLTEKKDHFPSMMKMDCGIVLLCVGMVTPTNSPKNTITPTLGNI